MISTRKNESFPEWTQIFAFGKFVDEVQGTAKALRVAQQVAKEHKAKSVNHLGRVVMLNSK